MDSPPTITEVLNELQISEMAEALDNHGIIADFIPLKVCTGNLTYSTDEDIGDNHDVNADIEVSFVQATMGLVISYPDPH